MSYRVSRALGAALGVTMVFAGCRAIDGLGGLEFDVLAPDGGGAGGGGTDGGTGGGTGGGGTGGGGTGGGVGCAPAGYDCHEAPPSGWSGPIAVYEGPPGTAPACPADYPTPAVDGGSGLVAPGTCTACTCSVPAVTCTQPLANYTQSSCFSSSLSDTTTLSDGACTLIQGSGVYYTAKQPKVTVDACAPAGGVPDGPPPTWTTEGLGCGASGAGVMCADAGLCLPRPPSPFEARWCIWTAGDASCPAAFSQKRAWESAMDARGCVPCTCGSPSAATCTPTTQLYSDSSCKQVTSTSVGSSCLHDSSAYYARATFTPGSASCTPAGGTPTGSVTATPEATICCAP